MHGLGLGARHAGLHHNWERNIPRLPKGFSYHIGLSIGNRHPKCDHDLFTCSTVLLSFSTRTYMVDSIHFLVLWRIYGLSLWLFIRTRLVLPGGSWIGVTGVWYYFLDSALSLRWWCILKDGWHGERHALAFLV